MPIDLDQSRLAHNVVANRVEGAGDEAIAAL
jgi:hypothetical protein